MRVAPAIELSSGIAGGDTPRPFRRGSVALQKPSGSILRREPDVLSRAANKQRSLPGAETAARRAPKV